MRARPLSVFLVVGAVVAGSLAAAAPAAVAAPDSANGGPGALSHFDLARKDCLGTARNTTSKIWYTVAGGVLSDVYAPTIDTTNVETMQYLVTDGSSFTDLQTRDTTYTVARRLDRHGLHGHVDREERRLPARHRPISPTRPAQRGRSRPRYTPLTSAAAQLSRSTSAWTRRWAATAAAAAGNGGADNAVVDTLDRLAGAGLVRHQHGDQRRQSRLRRAELPGPAGRPAVRAP